MNNFQRIQQAISEMLNNKIGESNVDLTLRLGLPNVGIDQNATNTRLSLNSVFLNPNLNTSASHDHTDQAPGRDHYHGGNSQISWWMRAQSQIQSDVAMNSRVGGAELRGAPSSNYTNIINNISVSYNSFANANLNPPQMNVDYIILNPSARRSQRRAGGSRRRSTTRRQRRSGVVDPNKRCTNYNCATGTTPMWRRGPLGPKSLCNACGIKYRKQEEKKQQKEAAQADDARDDKSDMSSCTTLNDYYQSNSKTTLSYALLF
ncbi:hypothetical protein FNV43_RR03040 [Rhamnella rubrinervis]|uniref:GATA-type domain-containing protein n=1 Tax=Rhamnella rubrinervis TaxID=2594499 RepID=A0A8K0HH93_9ROSA|nr:hypothetical protein FNV43_RR03040 [Rhamnella rubrinervis]